MSECTHNTSATVLSVQMLEARDTIRNLFPQTCEAVVAEYESLIKGRMDADPSLNILTAALSLANDAKEAGYHGSVLTITAAAVEMIEAENEEAP